MPRDDNVFTINRNQNQDLVGTKVLDNDVNDGLTAIFNSSFNNTKIRVFSYLFPTGTPVINNRERQSAKRIRSYLFHLYWRFRNCNDWLVFQYKN